MAELRSYDIGDVVEDNKFGPFTIIEDAGRDSSNKRVVVVRFNNENMFGFHSVVFAKLNNIRRGVSVKDPYYPTLCSVGCIGEVKSFDKSDPIYIKLRDMWSRFIKYCYDENSSRYYIYGAKGYYMQKRWHCLEYFLQDVQLFENYDLWLNSAYKSMQDGSTMEYVFDFDRTSNEMSLNTCRFVPIFENKAKVSMNIDTNTGFIGIKQMPSGNYEAIFRKENIGTFTDIYAALNYRNRFVKANTDNQSLLNHIPEDHIMSLDDIRKAQVPPNRANGKLSLYRVVNNNIDPDERLKELLIKSNINPSEIK